MSFEVHKEPLYRRYYASPTSAACAYGVFYGFIAVFLPLIIAYNSSSFWLKENITYEQPTVTYKYTTIVRMQGESISPLTGVVDKQLNLFYSTSPTVNALYSDYVRYPLLRSAEVDTNTDGQADRIEINVQMPIQSYEQVNDIQCLVFHDVQFNGKAKLLVDTVSHLSHSSPLPIGQLNMDADIEFRQKWPLTAKGGYRVPYETDPLMPVDLSPTFTSAAEVSMINILQKNAARNFSTGLKINYALADTATPYVANAQSYVNFTAVIRIPEQAVLYTPAVSEVLKFAWIQYISFFVITAFLLHRLTSFVFRNQLLHSYVTVDVMSNKAA